MNSRSRILLAEDDQVIRNLLVEFIQSEGFECDAAEDGAEAARKLSSERYDLLITDFRMPKMNGLELLNWCQGENLSLPVIFLTADFLLPHERQLISKLRPIHLSKPICLDHFLSTIHASIEMNRNQKCLA